MIQATSAHIEAIKARAISTVTRELKDGVRLTHAQCDEIGAEAYNWLGRRLALSPATDDAGVTWARRK